MWIPRFNEIHQLVQEIAFTYLSLFGKNLDNLFINKRLDLLGI